MSIAYGGFRAYDDASLSTLELQLSGKWLSGLAFPFRQISREFYKTSLP